MTASVFPLIIILRLIFLEDHMSDKDNFGIIEHEGIVEECDNISAVIKIISLSPCSGCHAEGACTLSGIEEKRVVVPGSWNVNPGDNVTIIMKKSTGYAAVLLSYILPLLLLVSTLIILTGTGFSELASGLLSIAVLIPYYLIIWLIRDRITNKFTFSLKI
jgi:sigma-E factor negative regulatory protein RseC